MDVGSGVKVSVGGTDGVSVITTAGVSTATVEVATAGVAVAALAGVAVTMEGVLVGWRNGVGGLYPEGWKNQPLQEDNNRTDNNTKTSRLFFISSPGSLYRAHEKRAKQI
jgi:hypothetical protein